MSIWNEQTKEQLRELVAADKSFREIALILGVSRSAIAGATRRWLGGGTNVPSSRWTDEERATLRRLAGERLTLRQICDQMGKGRNGVERQLKKLGLKAKPAEFVWKPGGGRPNPVPRERLEPVGPSPFLSLPFKKLKTTSCRYPHGDGPYTFCGQPIASGCYCQFHWNLCHESVRYSRASQVKHPAVASTDRNSGGGGAQIKQSTEPVDSTNALEEPASMGDVLDMVEELQTPDHRPSGSSQEGVEGGGVGPWRQIGEVAEEIVGRLA